MFSEMFMEFVDEIDPNNFDLEKMVKFNEHIAIVATKENNETESSFFKEFKKIQSDIRKIKKKSFGWSEERGLALQSLFEKLMKLDGHYYLEFCNSDYLTKQFPIEMFKFYVSVDVGRIGGCSEYDTIIRVYTNMLKFFNTSIFLKDRAFMPRLPSKTCYLYDPVFRQKVRELNRDNAELKSKYFNADFNLKEFAFLCIDKFFPCVYWRWTGQDHLAHVETLKLVVNMFEYGLWDTNDINRLLTHLYAVSEIMYNLENCLAKDCPSIDSYYYNNQQKDGCTAAREMIAASFIHMILMYLDEDVNEKLLSFNLDFNTKTDNKFKKCNFDYKKVKSIFKYSTFNRNKLYTYFSYILVTYLGRYKKITDEVDPIASDDLSSYLSLLFTYISDINGDFYKVSLKMLKPQYFAFYLLNDNNDYTVTASGFVEKLQGLVNNIKSQVYGQLNSNIPVLYTEIKEIFDEIYIFIETEQKMQILQDDIEITSKLVLCLYNIPQYVLALMQLIVELQSEPPDDKATIGFHYGLKLLRKIGLKNCPGFNQMFTGVNFTHMAKLYKIRTSEMNIITKQLVLHTDTLPLIERNPAIIRLNMDMYNDLINNFLSTSSESFNSGDFSKLEVKCLLSLYNYNDILNTLLETFSNKRSKYELFLADIIIKIMPRALETLRDQNKVKDNVNLQNFWNDLQSVDNFFVNQITEWDTLDNDQHHVIILELMRSFIKVFNRATARFYTHANMRTIVNLLEGEFRISSFFKYFDFEAGILVMSQIVRLYSSFMIFRQNHLINNRFEEFGNLETQTTEVSLSVYLMEQETIYEITNLRKRAEFYIETFGVNNHAGKFLFCNFFPMLFKYFAGILDAFVLPDYKSMLYEFDCTFNMLEGLTQLLNVVQIKITGIAELELQNRMINKYRKLTSVSGFLDGYMGSAQSGNSGYFYDESPQSDIYEKRKRGFVFLSKMIDVYQKCNRRKLHLEKYIKYDPYDAQTKIAEVMSKKLRFNYLYRKSENLANDEKYTLLSSLNSNDPVMVIKIMESFYVLRKTTYFENPESNQCFNVLKTADILKNNISSYISYFFTELSNMDLSFEKLVDNMFTNSSYISLILMMDNLIKISDEYRSTFYEFLTSDKYDEVSTEVKTTVMNKIWELHKLLYYFTLYKTYFDKDWAEIYTLYYLVSNFIQNLCEDNYVPFKLWFHNNEMLRDDGKSIFLYYFGMLEAAFHNTRVHKNTSSALMLSDRPELFNILIRLTNGMTEFINGGTVKTQFDIYKYKIDVWVGIILRVVDDVDSKFYELKENIITFILGLAEGFDEQVINFMATNFPVTRLYDLIYKLTKKLYIRQMLIKRNKHNNKNKDKGISQGYIVHRITEADENKYNITHTDDLLDFYKKYDTSFSDHVIMSVVIKAYTLMRDLSTKVVRYENFIIEKKEDIRTYIKNKKQTADNLQPLYVWHFLKRIIIDIEINYNEKLAEDGSEAEKSNIRVFYFKKLPQCFFLTDAAKDDFRARVKIQSLEEKHEMFFDEVNQYDIITNDSKNLYIKSKALYKLSTEESFYAMMFLLYIISLALNVMLLVTYDDVGDDFHNSRGNLVATQTVLSIILAALSFCFTVFWFAVKYRSVRKINWIKYRQTLPQDYIPTVFDYIYVDIYTSIVRIGTIQSFILTFILSLLGLLVNPFFYTLLLLLVVHLSLIVYNVALSFMNNYDKLCFTLLIILVVINSFSYLNAQFYRNDFSDDNIGTESQYTCSTYFSCLMNSVNVGLRAGGGISDNLNFRAGGKAGRYVGRLVFDVLFFITVNLILLGIFFGIIVDSFKELRDAMSKRRKDETDVCFTCGRDRPELERKGIDFEEHLKFHDIWNYFFFVQYLRWKPENTYDGIDIYVNNLIQDDYDTAWLPIDRTKENKEGDDK